MKKALRFLIPAAAVILIVLVVLWQNGVFSPEKTGRKVGSVTLEVRCENALAYGQLKETLRAILPEDGVLFQGTVDLLEDDTAFTVLERACRREKIALSSTGSTRYGIYVEGIGGLYEMDCGAQSGWMFSLNGSYPSKSAGSAELADGDRVIWVYTCDLGKDVGADAA